MKVPVGLFLAFVLLGSCIKDELNSDGNNIHINVTEKFFHLPAGTDSKVIQVALEMQRRNNIRTFIPQFA